MRITDNVRLLAMFRAGQVTSVRINGASRRAAAGQRLTTPSDDPVAYATVVRRDADLATAASRSRVARDAADELRISENALDSASTLMQNALALAVQGATESLSAVDRASLAQGVGQIREQMLEVANTKSSRGFVFSGTKTDTAAFDTNGAFQGNDGVVRVPVTDGLAPRGNVSGARAFTSAGGRDVFADLGALVTALKNNDLAGIRTSLDSIRLGHDQIVSAQVDSGLSIERLETSADVLDQSTVALGASRARAVGSDDPAALLTELSAASTAYQQSLEVTRRLLALPSLATM